MTSIFKHTVYVPCTEFTDLSSMRIQNKSLYMGAHESSPRENVFKLTSYGAKGTISCAPAYLSSIVCFMGWGGHVNRNMKVHSTALQNGGQSW